MRRTNFKVYVVSLAHPDPPDVGIPEVLEFGTDNIIILVEWIQSRHHENHTAYSIDAMPQVTVAFIKSTSAQLQISYNTQYNVSITAFLCGHSNATTMIMLEFGEFCTSLLLFACDNNIIIIIIVKCVHPLNLPMIDNSVKVLLDNDLALVDTNATFSCLSGLIFSGPMNSTCMENGEWEPDPQEVDCTGELGIRLYVEGIIIIGIVPRRGLVTRLGCMLNCSMLLPHNNF